MKRKKNGYTSMSIMKSSVKSPMSSMLACLSNLVLILLNTSPIAMISSESSVTPPVINTLYM